MRRSRRYAGAGPGLVDALGPGETGCLRTGTYAADDEVRIATPAISLVA